MENVLQEKVLKWLQQQESVKALRICDRYNKGYSDIFACVEGRFVAIELKDPIIGEESPHQVECLDELSKAGAVCGICRSVEDVKKLVGKARKKGKGALW